MKHLLTLSALLLASAPFASAQLGAGNTLVVGSAPDASALADLNGDGHVDMAVTLDNPDRVAIYAGSGDGSLTFAQSVLVGASTGPHTVVPLDIDADGDLDLAVSLQDAGVRLLVNNGGGSFALGASLDTGVNPRDLVVADLGGSAELDLVSANRDGNSVTIMISQGGGDYLSTTFPAGSDIRGVTAVGMDGAGDLDVAASSHATRAISFFANNGLGGFTGAGSVSTGGNLRPDGLDSTDLDGDGDDDLVVAASGNGLNVVMLFLNNGGFGGFSTVASGGGNPSYVRAANLDLADGPDLVVVNNDSSNIGVLLNDGAGGFGAATTFAAGAGATHVALGDLDGSGSDDVVVTNSDANSVTVLLNTLASAFIDLGNALAGSTLPALSATGTLVVGSDASWAVTNAAPSATAFAIVGFSTIFAPFKQGTLVPAPDFFQMQMTSAMGSVGLNGTVPASLPTGATLVVQYWIADALAPAGFQASNSVSGLVP